MRHLESYRKFAKIAQRCRAFAERRRAAYARLHDSGDWKIHYSYGTFQQRLREVADSAKRWDEIAAMFVTEPKPAADKPESRSGQRTVA